MKYRLLGKTGVRVSEVCLGSMDFGRSVDEEGATRLINQAIECGINFIDTADIYGDGLAESFIGKALRNAKKRRSVVLATKFRQRVGSGPNDQGSSRLHTIQACEDSLRRLNTDYIDLYTIHGDDSDTPVEETLLAIEDLRRSGKILYGGTSNFPAHKLVETRYKAQAHSCSPPVCEQTRYSILNRAIEKDVLEVCSKFGLGLTTFAPLYGGWLSGKYQQGHQLPGSRFNKIDWGRFLWQSTFNAVEKVRKIADKEGLNLVRFSLSWCLHNDSLASVLIGPRTPTQLQGYLAACETRLSEETKAIADRIVPSGARISDLEPWDKSIVMQSAFSALRQHKERA